MEIKDLIKKISIIDGDEVTLDLVKQCIDLDNLVYPGDYLVDFSVSKHYFEKNPYIYYMAVLDDQLVGYVNFCPVKDSFYNKMKSGKYIDTILTGNDILKYEMNKEYSNYFASIVIHKDYQHYGLANKLMEKIKERIGKLKLERNITIKRIVADVLNDGGKKLVSKLGLKEIYKSNHNTIIAEWEA